MVLSAGEKNKRERERVFAYQIEWGLASQPESDAPPPTLSSNCALRTTNHFDSLILSSSILSKYLSMLVSRLTEVRPKETGPNSIYYTAETCHDPGRSLPQPHHAQSFPAYRLPPTRCFYCWDALEARVTGFEAKHTNNEASSRCMMPLLCSSYDIYRTALPRQLTVPSSRSRCPALPPSQTSCSSTSSSLAQRCTMLFAFRVPVAYSVPSSSNRRLSQWRVSCARKSQHSTMPLPWQ